VVSETAADILYNQTEIGSFPMSEMQIPKKGGSLTIQQTVIFTISNGKHWEAFAKDLLHRSEFTWQLSSRMCLTVLDAIGGSALSLPCVRIMKSIDLHGMDSLNRNASVQAIELPGNLPDDKGLLYNR
jgi:hypothetical protein